LEKDADALIEARAAAGLSQSQLAKKMKTSHSYIARIEGGTVRPSTDALGPLRSSNPHAPSDHPDQRLEREREELSLNFASWNRVVAWLKGIDELRRAA
jgi:transcriptional regulator with XRE-family HTH domain